MNHRYLVALAAVFFVVRAQAQSTCASPLPVVAGVTYTVDTVIGTDVPLPVCSSGGTGATSSEWFIYTATDYVTVTVSSDLTQNGNTDTRVQIYSGACGNLTCVGGDDDSGAGLLTVAIFNAYAGQSYLIAWDNRYSSSGFDFTVSEQPWDPTAISFTNQGVSTSGNAYAAVDMNNDGYDDIVSVTATNIRIHYQQSDGTFNMVDYVTTSADYTPTATSMATDSSTSFMAAAAASPSWWRMRTAPASQR
jgi:hypothetical protein